MLNKLMVGQKGVEAPVLWEADTVIIGGSFAGVAAALELAKDGREEVAVIEPRTYLGREMTAHLRYWLDETIEAWPADLQTALQSSLGHTEEGVPIAALHPDRIKLALEELLLQAGVRLLYATLPVGFASADGRVTGVVIANKSGRQVIPCRQVLDMTETAMAMSLLGQPVAVSEGDALFLRSLELDGVSVAVSAGTTLEVSSSLGIEGDRVRLHEGARGEGHVYVEFALRLPGANTLEASRERENRSRVIGMELASYIIQQVPGYAKANLGGASYDLLGPWQEDSDQQPVDITRYTTPLSGVWSFFREVYTQRDTTWLQACQAAWHGAAAAVAIRGLTGSGSTEALVSPAATDHERLIPLELRIPQWLRPRAGREVAELGEVRYPVLCEAEVLVAGGGSSGASAAIIAAEEGVRTVLIDGNPGMGGTGTFGGVDSYWFGRRIGFAQRWTEAVHEVQRTINYKGHKWNIEAKMHAFMQQAAKAGTEMIFNSITFGTLMEGQQLKGALIATRWGPYAVLSKVTIDATGDGDVAVAAGAPFVYGSIKDQTVMWYSLAQFREPGRTKNNFTSMVHMGDIEDLTRAIMTGRRRGESVYDHSIYVATRESRHVEGEVTMTLADQLLHRRWEDCINIHFSNHDVKGVSGADWVHVGLLPPNLDIEIPYRMLLPKGVEGLLLAGKAISATHDALPAIRMQSDLENLGGITAIAAVMAVKQGVPPRQVVVRQLQQRVIQEGLLPETVLRRELVTKQYSDDELVTLVDQIETEPLYEYSNMKMNETHAAPIPFVEISSVGPRILPFLEAALAAAEGTKRIRIAQALAMYGHPSAVPVLSEEILRALEPGVLPKRTADIMYVTQPPDHGAMADTAYLLYSLAQCEDARSIAIWRRVAELVKPEEDDFKDVMLGLYYYIDAVASGAERLGSLAAAEPLLVLHEVPYLRNQSIGDIGVQPDYFLERRAMLELSIGRGLARCGHVEGYNILISYVEDARTLLAQQATRTLEILTGASLLRSEEWKAWLEENMDRLQPQPWRLKLDREWASEQLPRVEVITG